MIDFGSLLTTILMYILPISDPMVRMQISMAIGQSFGTLAQYVWKYMSNISLMRKFMRYNSVTIGHNHQYFHKIIEYYYKRHGDKVKIIDVKSDGGERQIMIEMMQVASIQDGDFYIKMAKESWEVVSQSEDNSTRNNNPLHGQKIIFSSKKPVPEIDKYVQNIIKECTRMENHILSIYNIDVDVMDKHRFIRWKYMSSTSNKTTKNNIVSDEVRKNFYEDLEQFNSDFDDYKTRGIQYKRGYCISGKPGSGKSTLWESIANEYHWPVFRLDMSIIRDNAEATKLVNSIHDWVEPTENHILLLEDLDRSEIFRKWGGKTDITMDCLLGILEGRGSQGRIIIITANDVRIMKDSDAGNAMFRPGRIDREIVINDCTIPQIEGILRLYFPPEQKPDTRVIELDSDIEITTAELNKVIILQRTLPRIITFLNKFKVFKSGEYIEELIKRFDENEDLDENDIAEIEQKVDVVQRKRKKKNQNPKPRKPRGLGVIEKLEKRIVESELEFRNRTEKDNLQYQIDTLKLQYDKIQLEEWQNKLKEPIEKYKRELEEYEKKNIDEPNEDRGNQKEKEKDDMDEHHGEDERDDMGDVDERDEHHEVDERDDMDNNIEVSILNTESQSSSGTF